MLRANTYCPICDACVPLSTEHLTVLPCKVTLKVIFNRDVRQPSSTEIPCAATVPPLQNIVRIGSIKSWVVSAISPPEQLSRAVPSHAVASPQTVHSYMIIPCGQVQSVIG